MNSKTFAQVLIFAACASLVACGPMKAKNDLFGKEAVPHHKTDVADRKIDEGEALFIPETFTSALGKFKEAATLDPANARGRFWLKFAEFILEFRGVLARMEPAIRSFPDGERRFAKILNETSQSYPANFFKYMRAPRFDRMQTADELVEWIDRVRLRMSEFRRTLKEIRDSEFSVTIPPGLLIGRDGTPRGRCLPLHFGPVQFMPTGDLCFDEGSLTLGLSRLDFDAIAMILSYNELILDLWSAWRINPEALLGTFDRPIETKSDAEFFVKKLFSAGKNGSLRAPRPFASIREMSADFLSAYGTAVDTQREACPLGFQHPTNRRGYLFNMGVCLNARNTGSDSSRLITMLEAIIAGRSFQSHDDTEVNFESLIENPPQNIKELLPLKLDKCDRLIGYNTKSLASFVPSDRRDSFLSFRDPCPEDKR